MPFAGIEEARRRVDALKGRSDSYVQKWIDIFNGCVEEHGSEKGDDHNCFAIASSQAGGD